MRWLLLALMVLAGVACDPEDVRGVAEAYLHDAPVADRAAYAAELLEVMPYYVTGAAFALLLLGTAILNGLEHARSLGRGEALRYGAYLALLGFIALFLAMAFNPRWLPPGHALLAFGATAVLAIGSAATLAKLKPQRAVLAVGYLSAGITVPMIGLLLHRDVYLMDTTASLLIGFAAGLLFTLVISDPVRSGMVDFLSRREADPDRQR
ncbi:MAG: hypothetical protein KC620_14110 [Myxococcales bacterium]|nr:hypothetical protein [Myxococcales bacterium]